MLTLRDLIRSYLPHLRQTTQLSVPVMIGQLGNVMMMVIDNVMIGELGYQPLSASALANSVFFIIAVLGMGVAFAVSPLVAEANAAGDNQKCSQYLGQGVWVGVSTGVLLGGLIFLSSYGFVFLEQPPEDVRLAGSYTRILSVSMLPMMLFLMLKHFADGLSLTRVAMQVTLLGLLFNTFANWLLIFGNWGFPQLALDGAGYATLSSRSLMMILMWGYIVVYPKLRRYWQAIRWYPVDLKVVRKILAIGLPSGFQYFFEVGAFAGAAVMVGWLGIAERAAHQIVLNMASISYMVVSGIAAGASIRVGISLGKRNFGDLRLAGFAGIFLGAVFMLMAALIFIWGKKVLPALYVDDPQVIALAGPLMLIAGLFQLFDGIQAVGIGILRGLQDVNTPTLITFVSYWGVGLPLAYLMGFVWEGSVNGVWYGLTASLLFASILLTIRFYWLSKKYQLKEAEKKIPKPRTLTSNY